MEPIELFSARVCPFAHRCRLALLEKGLPFDVVEIDLHDKPAWYRNIHPGGAVPALRQGDFVLRESSIINEYIEELAPVPVLLPETPRLRALARLWIAFADTDFVPLFYRLLKARDADGQREAQDKLVTVLRTIDEELSRRRQEGPYWSGCRVGLADIAFYPWFERWPVLEHYRGLALPGELKALSGWIETMRQRDAVIIAGMPAAFYIAGYQDYARGKNV